MLKQSQRVHQPCTSEDDCLPDAEPKPDAVYFNMQSLQYHLDTQLSNPILYFPACQCCSDIAYLSPTCPDIG